MASVIFGIITGRLGDVLVFLFFYGTFTMVTLLPPGVWLLPVSPGPPLLPPGLAGLEEELLFEEFADPVPEGVFPPD